MFSVAKFQKYANDIQHACGKLYFDRLKAPLYPTECL